jgi:hypothetical protein
MVNRKGDRNLQALGEIQALQKQLVHQEYTQFQQE